MQSTNAFNDNFAKFILIPLGIALISIGQAFSGIEHVLAALLVLPYILLAPTAGWVGDRFAKSRVIRWAAWFQLVVIILMASGLWFGARSGADLSGWALVWVMGAFLLLAVQSALLSPAKMGVVKELVGSERLGFANGVLEGTVIVAIVGGQIVGGFWFDVGGLQQGKGPWMSAMVPVWWLLIGAVLSIGLSYSIQSTEPKGSERYSWKLATRHVRDLGKLWDDLPMRRCALGIGFFWGFGGFLQLLLVQRAQEMVGGLGGFGLETVLVWMPVMAGIVLGSVTASLICRRSNEMGLVVVGGLVMTVSMFLLGVVHWEETGVRILLASSGAGAALLLVPLNTFFQDQIAESERGLMLSASNLCINVAGISAVAFQFVLKAVGVPVMGQFFVASLACGWVTVTVFRLLPRDFIRLVVLAVFRSLYKVRPLGSKHIPREGGVLLVANHVSYVDAFVLSAACPRPVRFVMFADCFEKKWVGAVARFFETVAISPTTARDGIRLVGEALKEGAVVCVFAEGQLSRTGALSEIKRGYQMMAKRGGAEIIPVYLDGLWGSMWSFAEGNFLRKPPRSLRYGVTVAFGEPLPSGGQVTPVLRALSVKTSADREATFLSKRNQEPKVVGDLPRGWVEMKEQCWADDEAGRGMRINALQLSQVHLASRKTRLLVEWVEGEELSGVLGILWPLSVEARVSLADGLGDDGILAKVARERIDAVALRGMEGRSALVDELTARGVVVWSFDGTGQSDGRSFGCLVCNGRVATFARPHPDYETTTGLFQFGWREGTRGKLLPGWPEEEFGQVDEEGFLL